MALSTVFHSIDFLNSSPLSHSVLLRLSCSHVVGRMRQTKCSGGLGQQPPSVRRSIACSPSGGPCRSSGANSSLVVHSASVPAGSVEELGWQVFRADFLPKLDMSIIIIIIVVVAVDGD